LRQLAASLVLVPLLGLTSSLIAAAPAAEPVPSRPQDPVAGRAYDVLDAHCSRCHQRGRLQSPYPATGLTNILALDAIARDPSLVRPGLPDGSALYTSLLRRAMPPPDGREAEAVTGPAAEEIEALRLWIEGLPAAVDSDCTWAGQARQLETRLLRMLRRLPAGAARRARFISLAHFESACPSPSQRSSAREGLLELAARLAEGRPEAVLDAGRDGSLVIAVDLDKLGWTTGDWDRLAANDPLAGFNARRLQSVRRVALSPVPVIRGDWLAHRMLRFSDPRGLAGQRGEERPDSGFDPELYPIAALARLWERGVDFATAAAELGLSSGVLAGALDGLPAELRSAGRRLRQGLVPRAEFLALASALVGAGRPSDPDAATPGALELAIWSDRDAYQKGDPVILYARASADCYLTLVSIDDAGRATVLLPNDLERDNLLQGGSERRVPGENAAYRLRAGKGDRETIAGICTTPHQIAEGIRPDYERQRFTSLGSWRAFLTNVLAGRAVSQQGESPPPPRRPRRARRAKAEEKPPPLLPLHHARTAIRFEVR
jgi:hypothetical protein